MLFFHSAGLRNFGRAINRFFGLLFLAATAHPLAATNHELQAYGAYSIADSQLRGALQQTYGIDSIDYAFSDYGGKFFWRGGVIEPGFSSGMYSALATRSTVGPGSIAGSSWQAASSGTYMTGDYRLGLAWVPLQFRARWFSFNDWFFAELGAGPAYGFGAAQYNVTYSAGGATANDLRYYKFNEWGFLTSVAVGFNFGLIPNCALQIFVEGAHIYAKIRNPDLTQTGSITWSQFFVRPGLAIVFTF